MQLFLAAFQSVPDPRAENTRHDLVEILIIAFIAVLCGAQNCSEMAEFGRAKIKLPLGPDGVANTDDDPLALPDLLRTRE